MANLVATEVGSPSVISSAEQHGLRSRRPTLGWIGLTLVSLLAFCRQTVHNLADYRPRATTRVSSWRSATSSPRVECWAPDMYVGFFGGDQHHFETLPLQHVLQAISFRLIGPGILQARLVSLVAGVVVVLVVGWLAFRWFGLATAVLTELLLIGWRSNLTAASDGLPLLGVARTARYDILSVAMVWLALAALDWTLHRPSLWRGLTTGACLRGCCSSRNFSGCVRCLSYWRCGSWSEVGRGGTRRWRGSCLVSSWWFSRSACTC